MGYIATWKILEEAVIDFRKRGVKIPTEIMDDLKNAKTTIQILRADPACTETMQRLDEYFGNVESYIISEGQKMLGPEYIDDWLKHVDEASRSTSDEEDKDARFVAGVTRQQKWIRVKPSTELPMEKLKKLAEESNLSLNIQNDGFLLVQGEDERVKDFVKKMATKYKAKSGKYR
jgi:hypothetical protein